MLENARRTRPAAATGRAVTYVLRYQRPHHVAVCDCGWASGGCPTPGLAGSSWDDHHRQVHHGAGVVEVVVAAPAELDAASVAELRMRLAAALTDPARLGPVVLDLGATTFIDACGLGTIVWFANEGERLARTTRLRHAARKARWLLDLTGVDRRFAEAQPSSELV